MIPMIFIIALYLEPVGSIVDEPFQYGYDELEFIEPRSLEQIEMEIERDRIRKQFRILEAKPDAKR